MNQRQIVDFQKMIWDFYKVNKRNLPWRNTDNPYNIYVSEVMLQQTQVNRVVEKYNEWIKAFPDFQTLSQSKLTQVLTLWSGLGYNRRGKFFHESAKIITTNWYGQIPHEPEELVKLPGIGKATAASIIVFSYNKELVFIETNIRRVFIHEFFEGQNNISDTDILPLISQTIDRKNPREWYYALMDYGSFLGRTIENPNRRSNMYSKQSNFSGSVRQVRGEILKIISKQPMKSNEIEKNLTGNKDHFSTALDQLLKESFLEKIGDTIQIKDHE